MSLTTYEAAAKRVRENKESRRKVAADFGVSVHGLVTASTNSLNGYLLRCAEKSDMLTSQIITVLKRFFS